MQYLVSFKNLDKKTEILNSLCHSVASWHSIYEAESFECRLQSGLHFPWISLFSAKFLKQSIQKGLLPFKDRIGNRREIGPRGREGGN